MNGFNISDIIDAKLGGTSLSAIYFGSNKLWPTVIDYSKEYFTIESLADSNTIIFSKTESAETKTIYWSSDKRTWNSVSSSTNTIIKTLSNNEKIYIKGSNDSYATSAAAYNYFKSVGKFNIYGNIMSLIYGDNFIDQTTLPSTSYTFCYIFSNSKVVDASNLILPATTLAEHCYRYMFVNCTSLVNAPELPATTLANNCYQGMFVGCASLKYAPELPVTTLTISCYSDMFWNCTSLKTAPELPATTLTNYCYSYMFKGCTSLTTAPELPARTLVYACYDRMFEGCTSLNYIKMLATNISATGCLNNWVSNVAATGTFVKDYSLKSIPINSASGIPEGWTIEEVNVDYSKEYFTIESLEDNNRILWKLNGSSGAKSISYSTDKTNWTSVTSSSSGNVVTTLNTGDKVYIKGNNSAYGVDTSNYNTLSSDGKFKVYGNIMSLLYSDNFTSQYTLSNDFSFFRFFMGSKITDATNLILPATTLSQYCYNGMFRTCSYFIGPPELPSTLLAYACYGHMFRECTLLTVTPELPATTLKEFCYAYMFYGCTSLTTAPELPATILVKDCYAAMFNSCTRLNYIKAMFTTTPSSTYTGIWVQYVANSGTFVKNSSARWNVTDINGIPPGWTVQEVEIDYSQEYFTIESLEDNNEIQFIKGSNAPTKTIEWSIDGTTWTSSTSSTTPTVVTTLNTGDRMMIRGNNTQYASSGSNTYENRLISTKTINMYGNIMSLLYGDNFVGQTTLPAKYTFCRLFSAGKMVDTSDLIFPATNTTEACYRSMLDNNTTLVYSPKILPALTLTKECYVNMFNKAYNLESSPILPALTLAQNCYGGLFYECGKLGEITCLATNISASQCTNQWVYNIKATGTFTKNSSMSSWTRGQYGIPTGWTVQNI